MKKVFITDTDSLLGEVIINTLSLNSEIELYGFGNKNKTINNRYQINIYDNKEIKNIIYEIKPDYIVNSLLFLDVEKAEKNKKEAMYINSGFTEQISRIASVIECKLIAFSDYNVFSNPDLIYEEADKQDPYNYLGKTFHSLENMLKISKIDYTLFRLGFLTGYSKYDKNCNYISNQIENLKNEEGISVPDAFIQPVFADDVANAVELVVENNINGIYNFAGDEVISYKDLFLKAAEYFRLNSITINVIKNQIYTKKSELINLKAKTTFNMNFTDISDIINFIKFQKD